jgi:hypothetical protein
MKTKKERIVCPRCGGVEVGQVWETRLVELEPYVRIHCCRRCGYWITAPEWIRAGVPWEWVIVTGGMLVLVAWFYLIFK